MRDQDDRGIPLPRPLEECLEAIDRNTNEQAMIFTALEASELAREILDLRVAVAVRESSTRTIELAERLLPGVLNLMLRQARDEIQQMSGSASNPAKVQKVFEFQEAAIKQSVAAAHRFHAIAPGLIKGLDEHEKQMAAMGMKKP